MSEKKEILTETQPVESAPACAGVTNDESEIDAFQAEIADLTDKYLRARAEIENVRRRADLDIQNAARASALAVAANFLPIIDAINAAVLHDPKNAGLQTLARAATGALEKTGITKIESVGKPLNPAIHNAVSTIPLPQRENTCDMIPAPNTIADEHQAGYMMNDTVLRPAMVVVYK